MPISRSKEQAASHPTCHFNVPGVLQIEDLHGDPQADLVLLMGGNQYMVMPELVAGFLKTHAYAKGVFYETLPPGILATQLRCGSLTVGSLVLALRPQIYAGGAADVRQLMHEGLLMPGSEHHYASNQLALLVRAGNPAGIESLSDLARPEVRVLLPDPATEGIGRLALEALERAGGSTLRTRVLAKQAEGTLRFTAMHHRQTPRDLKGGSADVGVVWWTEARLHASCEEMPLSYVQLAPAQNVSGTYVAAATRFSGEPGQAWLAFLMSAAAQRIFRAFGFSKPEPLSAHTH